MENLNQSLKEAVCIDEEVFFGPITDKERKIRERFENLHKNELNGAEVSRIVEDDENSAYKSFSVDESKYDSFDDSLNEINDKMPEEAKPILLKKSFDKIKSKRSGFYDSLEDVCSLVSNIDKCSISCEVENESNLNSKHFVEDSLKILSLPAANKNNLINDQVHFDDDSLAILECETTFSDSLEEVNVLESIEIEEINDIDNLSIENQNVIVTVNEHSACPKNLFDTSGEIFCEIKKDSDAADQEESFDDKNVLYDSLSNSDFKDILTDSLEENKQLKEMLNLSKHETINIYKENALERNDNKLFGVEYADPLPNLFDTSVEILSEKLKDYNSASPKEFFNNKNLLTDSLTNSEIKDVSRDSLEESDKSNENLNYPQQNIGDNIANSEDFYQKQIALDTSVQILSEKLKDCNSASSKEFFSDKNLLNDSLSNSDIKDVSKDSLEESDKSNKHLNNPQQNIGDNIAKSEIVYQKQIALDTSVQIISEKLQDCNSASSKEFLNGKNLLNNSLSNSEIKDVSKGSLKESEKSNENSNIAQQIISDNIEKSENVYQKQNALETSVQIIYDNASDYYEKKSISRKMNNSEEVIEMCENFQGTLNKQTTIETGSQQPFASKSPSENVMCNEIIDDDKSTLISNQCLNEDVAKANASVVYNPATAASVNDVSNVEPISLESCHLKLLNDDINIEKDLKFQLHIEVKVGDKKCQIASQDIKIVPVISEGCKSENNSISTISMANPLSHSNTTSCMEKDEHFNNLELNLKGKNCNAFKAHSPSDINSNSHEKSEAAFASNITLRAKSSASQTSFAKFNYIDSFSDISLLEALDLSDISTSFLNESVIQSKDSLISLNLYSPDECIQNFHASQFKNKNKENIPEHIQAFENENLNARRKSLSPNKVYISKTPQSLHKCSSFKETSKKTPGTKIPVRKVDNFAIPAITPSKFTKPLPTSLSAEKVKKCQHSPHSVDSGKKTPGTTPNKIPHICNVRNTIFSKVPQIIPSKKYMNVQSPVAQYIKSNSGPVKTPGIDPVLRDCMNRMVESPLHLHHAHTTGSLKTTKKKA